MKILIRVDDFGWTSEESDNPPLKKTDAGLRIARKFHDALDGIPYLAAVIPAVLDVVGREWLLSKPKGLTVALHGWSHREPNPGDRHEFEGMSQDEVRGRICSGQGVCGPTPYYVPPFNGLDHAHVPALWHEGIRYIFGREQEWGTPPSPVELANGVKFIPAWARLYGALGWKQGSAEKRLLDVLYDIYDLPGFAVMTLHLPWEHARDPEFKHTRVLQEFKGHFISADDFVREIK